MQIYVTPRRGADDKVLRVPNPETGYRDALPAAGKYVADNSYWRRRARDEEITITPGPAPAVGEVSTTTASEKPSKPAKRRARTSPAAKPAADFETPPETPEE